MQHSVQASASSAGDRLARLPILGRAEKSLRVAVLLSVAGGFLDAFTWIAHHGVMANAQTANVVLLAVYAAIGQWEQALRWVPSIAAFLVGVFSYAACAQEQAKRSKCQLRDRSILVIEVWCSSSSCRCMCDCRKLPEPRHFLRRRDANGELRQGRRPQL